MKMHQGKYLGNSWFPISGYTRWSDLAKRNYSFCSGGCQSSDTQFFTEQPCIHTFYGKHISCGPWGKQPFMPPTSNPHEGHEFWKPAFCSHAPHLSGLAEVSAQVRVIRNQFRLQTWLGVCKGFLKSTPIVTTNTKETSFESLNHSFVPVLPIHLPTSSKRRDQPKSRCWLNLILYLILSLRPVVLEELIIFIKGQKTSELFQSLNWIILPLEHPESKYPKSKSSEFWNFLSSDMKTWEVYP